MKNLPGNIILIQGMKYGLAQKIQAACIRTDFGEEND